MVTAADGREARRRPSLRMRITAGALVVVVAVFCGAGLLVISVLQREMVNQIDSTLTANVDFIDRTMSSGGALPTGEGPTDMYVQFLGPDGQVIGASTSAKGLGALAPSPTSGGGSWRPTIRCWAISGCWRSRCRPTRP